MPILISSAICYVQETMIKEIAGCCLVGESDAGIAQGLI